MHGRDARATRLGWIEPYHLSPVSLVTMKLNVLDPWYADGLKFTCQQCGNCCTGAPGYVWISDVEITRLAAFLKIAEREVIRQYCRKVGQRYTLKEIRNSAGQYDCVFLKEEPSGKPRLKFGE